MTVTTPTNMFVARPARPSLSTFTRKASTVSYSFPRIAGLQCSFQAVGRPQSAHAEQQAAEAQHRRQMHRQTRLANEAFPLSQAAQKEAASFWISLEGVYMILHSTAKYYTRFVSWDVAEKVHQYYVRDPQMKSNKFDWAKLQNFKIQ